MLLEICVASSGDCFAAEQGGADRVELNAALELGGLTPSLGTLTQARRATKLPILVMIRPRPGGFDYSLTEFDAMGRDAELALEHGADGVAFGILRHKGRVDVKRCQRLIRRVQPHPVVFHRAFDLTPDPVAALDALIDLGVTRVLTSGQEATAYNGAARIAELIGHASGRIEILPGGGINRFTVRDVVARTGCTQVHASLRATGPDASVPARFRGAFGKVGATDLHAVLEMRRLLDQSG